MAKQCFGLTPADGSLLLFVKAVGMRCPVEHALVQRLRSNKREINRCIFKNG